ncbi:MAG TPA: PDZ domain-containing protein [candidate division Zixibacteria bacterium]
MLEDRAGVLVSFVEVEGSAGKAELLAADVIRKVEDKDVTDLKGFKEILDQFKSKKEIMLTVKRGKSSCFVLLSNTGEEKQ